MNYQYSNGQWTCAQDWGESNSWSPNHESTNSEFFSVKWMMKVPPKCEATIVQKNCLKNDFSNVQNHSFGRTIFFKSKK